MAASIFSGKGAGAAAAAQGFPFENLELNLEADSGEVFLDELVHRKRLHLPRAGGRYHHFDLAWPARVEPCFAQQPLRALRVVFDLEARSPKPWMTGCDLALCRDREFAEELDEPVPVDREVRRAPNPNILERRVFKNGKLVGPEVRVQVGDDLHAALAQSRDAVGSRGLDKVDLAREKRGHARIRIRHAEENQTIGFRDARRIPVVRVLHELRAIALDAPLQDERPRTRRALREAPPVTAGLSPSAPARIQQDRK